MKRLTTDFICSIGFRENVLIKYKTTCSKLVVVVATADIMGCRHSKKVVIYSYG